MFRDLSYPQVSEYTTRDAGDYRIQFLDSGGTRSTLAETTLHLSSPTTAALVGYPSPEIHVIEDDRGTTAGRARVRLFNAVPDFPAPFDLAVVNGQVLAEGVQYLQESSYTELIPGIYDLELRRAGTKESTAVALAQSLAEIASYTVFAVGSLKDSDVQLLIARDSP